MNFRAVAFVLGNLWLILAASLLFPLAVEVFSVASGDSLMSGAAYALLWTSLGSAFVGFVVRTFTRDAVDMVRLREGFAIVTFSWLTMTGIGMMPYILSGAIPHVSDAFFETMSGFTTTGASILPEVEVLSAGLMFWRCMTQWLGGMGVVVLSVALLPILGVGGYRLLKAETPGGVTYERDRPRMSDAARSMWKIYLFFSVLLVLMLWLGGMSLYDAVCHSFTTMSTGGFSTHTASVGFFDSAYIQWVIIFFMFLAGSNFALYEHLRRFRLNAVLRNGEFIGYSALMVGSVVVGVLLFWYHNGSSAWIGAEATWRRVAFQVLSIATTTGFSSEDFDTPLWPHALKFTLFMLMFVGGCMGSTAGGVKVARVLVYAKLCVRELNRMVYPHSVRPLRMGGKVMDRSMVTNIAAFLVMFVGLFVLGAATMSVCGYDLTTSMSASAAALGNIGPGLGKVGPAQNWQHLPDFAKYMMSFLMLSGRLELFSVLVLFTSWAWRR